MSKIDKLSIYGIRSFAPIPPNANPKDKSYGETIQFHTPLTLIVGFNGSGKTTIIECLKYATTGDMPPNTKGGAFIHDPQLVGEREVLGQVKISFKATSGAKMVCTRNLQLTVKKASRTMKTLEGNLLMMRNGERVSVSSRVAELDQMLPQYLGVSKAILDNVIFCHQDESLWPMSEPSVLKKKFDEIFEAMKYTKAIENIKVLRKKQNEELGKFKLIEQHAKEDKEKGDRAEKKARELAAQIERMKEQRVALESQSEEAQMKASDAFDHMARFNVVVESLEGKRNEARYKESNISDLEHTIKRHLSGSDENLEDQLQQHDGIVRNQDSEWATLEKQYRDINDQISDSRAGLSDKQREHGRLQGAKERYDTQLVQRESLVKETARRHEIPGYDGQLDDSKVADFMDRVSRMAQEQNAAFQRTRREFQAELREAQLTLSGHNEQRTVANSTKESLRTQITADDRKIADLQRQFDRIDFDEGSKAQIESSIQSLTASITQANAEAEKASWDLQIQEGEKNLRELKNKADDLKQELFQVHQRAEEAAQVDLLQKQVRQNRHSFDTMKGAHEVRLTSLLGEDWEKDDLEATYQHALDAQSTKLRDAELQRESVHSDYKEVDLKLNLATTEMGRKQQDLDKCAKTLAAVLDGKDASSFPAELEEAEKVRDELKADYENASAMMEYLRRGQTILKDKECCQLCTRVIKTEKDKTEFRQRLQALINKYDVDTLAEELKQAEKELIDLRQASMTYDTWKRLSQTDLPTLREEKDRLDPRREDLLSKVERHDESIAELKTSKRNVESLAKTLQNMLKYQRDAAAGEHSLKELSSRTSQSQSARSLDDIKQESDRVEREMNHIQASVGKFVGDRDRSRTQINQLQIEVREARANLDRADYQLKNKHTLGASIEELASSIKKARDEIRRIDQRLQELNQKIAEATARCDDIASRGNDREKEVQDIARALESSVNQLRLAEKEICDFIKQGGPQMLSRSKSEMGELNQEIEGLEDDKSSLTKQMNVLKEKMTNQEGVRDNLSQNLRFRQQRRQLDALRSEIEDLEAKNAERDRNHWHREGSKWQAERVNLDSQVTSLHAEARAKDDQLTQLIKDWETDYQDAAYKYKEAHIQVETTKAAVEDLGRYGGALDKAIMKYHSLKMEEINHIMEELWKKTYRGADVDSILIRSDNEGGRGNKTNNYRVCMVKSDVEMDMRGRCSAGQRVLASIIIRLALAECFGVNCGLIALDEPTTNLDRDNIMSLAGSLHDIIRYRQSQSNFQLIVITHDADFLKAMQCQDFCDDYYRVERNEEQKSEITQMPINEMLQD